MVDVLDLGHVRLHIADEGPRDAPAVVFANSLGTDLRLWDAMLPHLPKGLRVIRADKRGHGLSQTTGAISIEDLADDVAAMMDALGVARPVFVGLSIGGLIGQSLALRHGDKLGGLVLSNTAAKIGDSSIWTDRIAAIREGGIATIAEPTMQRWFSPNFRALAECEAWRLMLERQDQAGYLACCQAIAEADYREALSAVDRPVLCIGGSLDGSTPPDAMRDLTGRIKGARLEIIEGAGHLPCVEAPEEYARLLTGYLAEIGHI
ncbi:3-oxoadipate enol-lactonase [Paracoccus tegillarcae]|uniref:3-oxoadipate enol-lactonase n=1 Tax=Paracoccus tegillarcae TaxID=1529068 RepID=A0A2K9EFA5_9RHOB|nr:3-oxoadipate enol-lactonase [Paracoccus tegillarcae]AUH33640.1 3-oxoadipate enol-lactonase [Paracoccus tegillarcae]